MPRKTFPFKAVKDGDLKRPYLPVKIINKDSGRIIRISALIDTGADECAMPVIFAKILGHDLEKGAARPVITGGGVVTAWRHTAILSVEGFPDREAVIDFVPALQSPLIGVRSFLSDFILTVDYPGENFTLECS